MDAVEARAMNHPSSTHPYEHMAASFSFSIAVTAVAMEYTQLECADLAIWPFQSSQAL